MKDLKHLIYFENLLQEANNELVQQAKAEGEHALGYTCYFVPETLLNLPGCFSSRLRAPNTSIDVGTYYMSSKICSYTRSILERGIEGGYDYLDALLSSETCQMMHRGHEHFEILGLVKEKNPQFFMSMMDVPFSDEDFAVDHYEEQLRVHVLEPLHETYGIDISDKAIRAAIRDHNEISRVMTEIGDLRKAANPVITGYEFHVLQLVSQVCPHKRILPYLKQTLTELKRRKPDAQPWFRVRLVVTGSEIDDPAFTKLIEDCGAMVVADRYCFGSMPGREEIPLEEGKDAQEILSDGLMRGMTQLGEDFSANRAFVPEMLLAARCMAAATELLKPYMTGESSETIGRVCLGTVRGDMHDIGKNLVKIMMEGSGLEVVDLGVDVTAEQFVDTAIEQHCDIIACSSLLTTTMPEMRDVVELAKARGIRDRVKIFVGGAPITPGYSDEIGADVYCPDAATAARSAVALLRGA